MLKARRVWVVGFRAGHSFATYLHWQVFQVVDTIAVVPGAGQTLAEHLVAIDERDCVIVFGLRRQVRQINKILDLIAKTGASVLYISDAGIRRRKGQRGTSGVRQKHLGPLSIMLLFLESATCWRRV